MAHYSVVASFPTGESIYQTFEKRDAAARFAYRCIYNHFKAQALLDRQCAWNAIAQLPDDIRTIPVADCGRRVLRIECGFQRAVSINAGPAPKPRRKAAAPLCAPWLSTAI